MQFRFGAGLPVLTGIDPGETEVPPGQLVQDYMPCVTMAELPVPV